MTAHPSGPFCMKEKWWKPALIFYVKTTAWIAGPIGAIFLLGAYVDIRSSLFRTILAFALSFAITCYGLYKEIREYKKTIE